MTQTVLSVGILTDKSITLYLPILQSLPTYQVILIYDASPSPPSPNPNGPPLASTPEAVLTHPSIDLILNFLPAAQREQFTIAALSSNKHVMVENPVSVSLPSAHRILDAERHSQGRVFVASARRYAPCFETFKSEVSTMGRIYYARCRNIVGVGQGKTRSSPSHMVERQHLDVSSSSSSPSSLTTPTSSQDTSSSTWNLLQEVFPGQELTPERIVLSRLLTGRACYDLSLMREAFGAPDAVSNISVNEPFYSAVFHYSDEYPFTLTYDTGEDAVPRCDAQLTVYGENKTVTLQYGPDPVSIRVEMADEKGELRAQEMFNTREDVYRCELDAMHAFLTQGEETKTTTVDSIKDLKVFRTIFEQFDRQCGTIRTPLG
ncbi:hypothetical protein EYZ11_004034 [Aspergillus tanneri]|uniref:Gfo/Idh/MocA-like oxidoreductase N-terminal domain-containing protein n=1 Tax=Aspergillus tanneri TaxID=1220188 RepID=A0A4S3JM48_9EURO|nr:uncharacterized protein ATNIH1004_004694 [Aspergillus tanneri]KAA8648809.1 hypothetical protein ATNIH1004_004694 [Aspergillus tanneri]THC96490.1 hypothetical protein EYZ11_004034 [Aspergillus tanneri]